MILVILMVMSAGLPLWAGYGDLPSAFEPNRGQASSNYQYLVRSAGYSLSLAPREAAISVNNANVRMRFIGSKRARIEPLDPLPGHSNYYLGADRSRWIDKVPHFARVRYNDLWPGIDLVFYGKRGRNEYDFVVHPNADPDQIAFTLDGPKTVQMDAEGNLVLAVTGGSLTHLKPVIYQERDGKRHPVRGAYRLSGRTVRFHLPLYDRTRPLIIDPVLTYSTYIGGQAADVATAIAVDATGSAIITGYTNSIAFPTVSPHQASMGGYQDVFITKLNPQGTALLYSTYLGGTSTSYDTGAAIAVDAAGNAYVTGTAGPGFPTTPGVIRTTNPTSTGDAFLAKFSPAGALLYSTLLGGSNDDVARGVAVDASGNAYITGQTTSSDFPTTPGAFDTTYPLSQSAFVTKLNSTATSLLYSTFLGVGSGYAIAINAAGEAYIGGSAGGSFPTTIGAYRISCGPGFLTKLASSGAALAYSTCMPVSVSALTLDSAGNLYSTGVDYGPAWVYKLNPAGSALLLQRQPDPAAYGTFNGIAIDAPGNIYLGGTLSNRAAVVRLAPTGGVASYDFPFQSEASAATGIAVDSNGAAYITGYSSSPALRTTSNAYDVTCNGLTDSFVSKIDISDTITARVTVDTRPQGLAVTVDGVSYTSPQNFDWTPGVDHILSAPSPQPGTPGTRYVFNSWSTSGYGPDLTYKASISGSNDLIAYFYRQYQVNLLASPPSAGTVTGWSLSGGYTTNYPNINLSATANPGFRFSSWSGDVTPTSPLSPNTEAVIDKPATITANFVPCMATVREPGFVLGPFSQSGTLTVTAASNCVWSASVSSNWLNGGTPSAAGPGTVTFTTGSIMGWAVPRTANIQFNGFTVPAVQKQPTVVWRESTGALRVKTRHGTMAMLLPAGFAGQPSATQTFEGDTLIAARDQSNSLWIVRYDAINENWAHAVNLGGWIQGNPAITMAANGMAYIAIRDYWNSYWVNIYNPATRTGSWLHLGGILATDPAIAAGRSDSIYVVGKDNWTGIWSNRILTNGGAQGWRFGGGLVKGNPSVTVGPDDVAYIAVRDNFDAVYLGRVQQETWLSWLGMQGTVSADPQITADFDSVRVASLDASGNIYYRTYAPNTSSFSAWTGQWSALQDFSLCAVGRNVFLAGRARNSQRLEWYGIDGFTEFVNGLDLATGPIICGPR